MYDVQFGEFSNWFNTKEARTKLADETLPAVADPNASQVDKPKGPDWEMRAPSTLQGGIGMGAGAALGALMGLATSDNDDEQPWKRALAMGLMTGALGLGAATAYASRPQDPEKPSHDGMARRFGRGATRAAVGAVEAPFEGLHGVLEELGAVNPGDPNFLRQAVAHLRGQGHNVTEAQVAQELAIAQATSKQPGMAERVGQFMGQVRKAPESFMKGYNSVVAPDKTKSPATPAKDPAEEAMSAVPEGAQPNPKAQQARPATPPPTDSTAPTPPIQPTVSNPATSAGPVKSDVTPGPVPDAKPAGQPPRQSPANAPGEGSLNLDAASKMKARQDNEAAYSAALKDPKNRMRLPEDELKTSVAPKPSQPLQSPGGAKPGGLAARFKNFMNPKNSPVLQGAGKLFTQQPNHRAQGQQLHSQYAGGTY